MIPGMSYPWLGWTYACTRALMLHGVASVALGAGLCSQTNIVFCVRKRGRRLCWKFQTRALGAVAFSGCRSDRARAVQKEVGGVDDDTFFLAQTYLR